MRENDETQRRGREKETWKKEKTEVSGVERQMYRELLSFLARCSRKASHTV